MTRERLDENRSQIDNALVELLNIANPVLESITGGRYRKTNDPLAMLKYCMNEWNYIERHLAPLGIKYQDIEIARASRNMGSHRNESLARSSEAHARAAVIHRLKENFQKATPQTNKQMQLQGNGQRGRQHQPQRKKPKQKDELDIGRTTCNNCGYVFSRAKTKPRNGEYSLWAEQADKEAGEYALYCPACNKARIYRKDGSVPAKQAVRDFFKIF